jgi:hypothetical protein
MYVLEYMVDSAPTITVEAMVHTTAVMLIFFAIFIIKPPEFTGEWRADNDPSAIARSSFLPVY